MEGILLAQVHTWNPDIVPRHVNALPLTNAFIN